jgi:hypothetical protein
MKTGQMLVLALCVVVAAGVLAWGRTHVVPASPPSVDEAANRRARLMIEDGRHKVEAAEARHEATSKSERAK